MRTHGLPYCLIAGNRMTLSTQIMSGLTLVEHAGQVLLRPFGGVDDRRPAILHVVVDLVVGRLAEVRDVAVDEVLPELRHLLGRHRRGQVHRMRLEAVALVDVDEARVGQEHRFVAARLDGLGDADGIERRAEGGFREKCDRLFSAIGLSSSEKSVCENSGVGGVPADLDGVAGGDRAAVGGIGRHAHQERLCRTAPCGCAAAGRARDRPAPRPARRRLAICCGGTAGCARAAPPRRPRPRRHARRAARRLISVPSAVIDAASRRRGRQKVHDADEVGDEAVGRDARRSRAACRIAAAGRPGAPPCGRP